MSSASSNNHLEIEDIYAIGEERSRRRSSCKESISYTNRVIDQFAESINMMNEAVLVPSKLRDIEVSETLDFEIAPKTDLYQYYAMLNSVKDDLFNGLTTAEDGANNNNNNNKCDRQSSDEAFTSLTSLSSLSSGGLDGEPLSFQDRANQLTGLFVQHLHSLYAILQHFSKAAKYITKRYHQEIEGNDEK
jgi:hypothetical protein